MSKKAEAVDESGHLTDRNDSYMQAAQVVDLDKHHGLQGDEIVPGVHKILANDGQKNGGVNLVIDHVGGKHQHWQKHCDETGENGYWINISAPLVEHRKENPISSLIAPQ